MSGFLKGKDVHGWKNTNGFSEDPRVAGGSPLPAPAAPSICRLERPVFGPILARFLEAGWPENPKTGGKGSGRKRPVWVAETSVGPGGKFRGSSFLVYSNGRVFPPGPRKRGSENQLSIPSLSPRRDGSRAPGGELSTGTPITKCCTRMTSHRIGLGWCSALNAKKIGLGLCMRACSQEGLRFL